MRWSRPARLAILILLTGCAGSKAPTPVPPGEPAGDSQVGLVRLEGPVPLTGAFVEGNAGDWHLFNERLHIVVSGRPRPNAFAVSGGNLIDAAPHGGADLLREVFTYLDDTFPRQAVYDSVFELPDSLGSRREVAARGYDSGDPDVSMETVYALSGGADFVEIRTTLVNRGTNVITGYALGDAIQWGLARPFAPGPGRDLQGTRPRIPYLLGAADSTAYGWMSDGDSLGGPHGASWSDPIVGTVDLLPGEPVSYMRRLYVASGGAADAAARIERDRGRSLGVLDLRVLTEGGIPVAGAFVDFFVGDQHLAWTESAPDGRVLAPVREGLYDLVITHPSHGRVGRRDLRIQPGAGDPLEVRLPESANLVLAARVPDGAPSPARWTLEELAGAPHPEFGLLPHLVASLNAIYSAQESLSVRVAPGVYAVTATRGPGFEAWRDTVTLASGVDVTLGAILEPLPVPSGWVAMDSHVHSDRSPDSGVAPDARLVTLAAEGIDWFVATDHGWRTAYDSLAVPRLAGSVRAIVGEEVTTPVGHLSVFPLTPGVGTSGVGVMPETFGSLMDELRANSPGALLQLNHPRSGRDGYFDRVDDPRVDFDLIELLNGKRPGGFDAAWADWLALVALGRAPVAVGNSDCHALAGGEVGAVRNYVRVDTDLPTQKDVLDALGQGRVQVSNGPFIEFTLDGRGPGETLTHSQGTLTGHVRVTAPAWVDVERVLIIVGGQVDTVIPVPRVGDAVRFDEPIEVSILGGTSVLVRVEGRRSMAPIVLDRRSGGEVVAFRPVAFTNPIWVDVPRASR